MTEYGVLVRSMSQKTQSTVHPWAYRLFPWDLTTRAPMITNLIRFLLLKYNTVQEANKQMDSSPAKLQYPLLNALAEKLMKASKSSQATD